MKVNSKKRAEGLMGECLKDGYCQGIATTLYVLSMTYGFREKRLKRVVEEISGLLKGKWGGHRLEVHQLDKWLQSEYNINLDGDIQLVFKIRKVDGERSKR